jgi:hypothetical protein
VDLPSLLPSTQWRAATQAFATTLGDGTITLEHVLMALLWDPVSASSQVLWRLGVSRERIVERLRDSGVPVPSSSLPPSERSRWETGCGSTVRTSVWFLITFSRKSRRGRIGGSTTMVSVHGYSLKHV